NSKARQRIYEARRSLGDGIFVQEHLTKLRGKLAYEARQLVRSKKIDKTWVAGSRVYASRNDVKLLIKDMEDIALVSDGKLPTPSYP
ncbi:MAG: hypothetical protein ABW185_04370, partial [Sedimenticola sp.]